ncbi:MAG: tetratricopeptide repeat protein [Bryobacteraceae bacterium]
MRLFSLMLLAFSGLLGQTSDPLSSAEDLYSHSDYQASLALIRLSEQASSKAYLLAGRDHYMLGDYKKAVEALERAFAMEPSSSECALWLGRGYGRRGETSSLFSAPRYASKARAYFEKAIALDPDNQEALRDLFDYYLEAPGFLGGGYDKAERIAKRIGDRNPADGLLAQAELADRRKQFDSAEEQFGRAAQMASRQVGRVLDLARSLARQGRISESEAAFDQAEQLEPNSPQVSFARARTYIEQKRNLEQARALLIQYLRSNPTPDEPSRQQAEKLLKEASGA